MWHLFFEKYQVPQFITAQEPGDISRVLFQKMHGSRHSFIFLNSSYDVVYRDGMDGLADSNFSFMVYDRLITSKVSIDYFKKNENEIGEYLENGILPSDYAHKVKNDPVLKKEMMKELGIPDDKIIISFFDVSMGKEHMLTFEEAFELIQCMGRLLNSNENYFFIYKSRALHHLLEGSEVKDAFNNFINEERVLFVNEIPLEYISTHYMGLSDFVISCYASSVGLEAVSGGIKAIYYTPKRFYKSAFKIVNFPNFCSCGYVQLKEHTDYWLNHCTEADFKEFQEKYIKRYIDKYCDGASNNRLETFLLSDIR
jgi:polysaccharide biosynthesis PFTS motif protein